MRPAETRMRRLLFISHETTLTGAPIQLLHLVRWLKNNGWDLLVAAPEPGPISELLATDGIPTTIHPNLLEEPGYAKLRELAAQSDVVLANTIVSWRAVRAAHAEKKPVIWYLHETLVAVRLIRQIPQIGPALELATLLVTPTRQTARVYQGITTTPIEVVPYGIPRVPAVPRANRDPRPSFITLATIEPRKGQDILVDAIRKLPPQLREAAKFRFVGRPLEEEFSNQVQAKAIGLSNIEFTGERDHPQSLELLAQSDALVCPSRDETMPITILEAMSLGKVVISAKVGGIAEWLHDGMNGLLVPPEDSTALAGALERCLTDQQLAAQLAAAAERTFLRHFTLERFAARFADLLQNVSHLRKGVGAIRASRRVTPNGWRNSKPTIDRTGLRRALRSLRRQPLVSIVLPVYNADLRLLEAAIESVEKQIYQRWELCIGDRCLDRLYDPAVSRTKSGAREPD